MIKITPEQLQTVTGILALYAPEAEVWAFGSRVDGTPKDYSDLDLVIVAREALDIVDLGEMREAFSRSDLPFRIDVLDWNVISDEFKRVIADKYEVVQSGTRGPLLNLRRLSGGNAGQARPRSPDS
jgi:predicted nucleotidyltransferase